MSKVSVGIKAPIRTLLSQLNTLDYFVVDGELYMIHHYLNGGCWVLNIVSKKVERAELSLLVNHVDIEVTVKYR